MTRDKLYLAGSLTMMTLAILYTVWSFSGSGTSAVTARDLEPPPMDAGMPGSPGSAPAIDPTQIPPVPDVVLDRLPQFGRNPFASTHPPVAPVAVAEAVEEPQPDPVGEVVVATILYSRSRQVAIVNGKRTRVGDRVGNETVVEILPNAIVLESPERGRRTVERRSVRAR